MVLQQALMIKEVRALLLVLAAEFIIIEFGSIK
jgi:hypothetical protein